MFTCCSLLIEDKYLLHLPTTSQNCVCSGVKPAYVTLIGNIIVGMLLVLPSDPSTQGPGPGPEPGLVKGPSLQEQGALVFKAILYGTSELCMPYVNISLSSQEEGSAEKESLQKNRLAAVQLLGALIGTYSSLSSSLLPLLSFIYPRLSSLSSFIFYFVIVCSI